MYAKPRFTVIFLHEAKEFLDNLTEKPRDKIIYNIWKSRSIIDDELFKKLSGEIWEFRTTYNKVDYRLFAFWDRSENKIVIATHGIIKKSNKTPKKELEKAEKIRIEYFKIKKS
ncbi:MAG: type II toxin-antitoxin system RelE/ParE family toxin [Saprospiraceae bacterium]|nr:type II toxin-antitoxin system RelE/ParE family toxin [Saprospiraceae bacterium]MBK8956814.1 type II toxin-antitoxin system RelE/ParE family toxin [Saprospiraceae bacterium]